MSKFTELYYKVLMKKMIFKRNKFLGKILNLTIIDIFYILFNKRKRQYVLKLFR